MEISNIIGTVLVFILGMVIGLILIFFGFAIYVRLLEPILGRRRELQRKKALEELKKKLPNGGPML